MPKDCTKANVIAYLMENEYPDDEANDLVESYAINIEEGLEDGLSAEAVGDALIKLDMEDFDNQLKEKQNGKA